MADYINHDLLLSIDRIRDEAMVAYTQSETIDGIHERIKPHIVKF